MYRFQPASALDLLSSQKAPFLELFAHGSLRAEIYQPQKVDLQTPHDRDEIYVVINGAGQFECDGKTVSFSAGDFFFVPAFVPHHFFDFSDDFATWVFFFGPTGGEAAWSDKVEIVSWQPAFRNAFFQLNKQWIEVDFKLEPLDIAILSDPETHILAGGGRILVALLHGMVIGVVALRRLPSGEIELTKMAVAIEHRSKGIGMQLMNATLDTAREMGLQRLILYSNRDTSAAAVQLYRKMGWQEINLEKGLYQRANIKMEYWL